MDAHRRAHAGPLPTGSVIHRLPAFGVRACRRAIRVPRIVTHILAAAVALVAGLGGLSLAVTGGMRVWEAYMRFDLTNERVGEGLLLQALGAVFLAIAVVTGRWSPLGLLLLGLTAVAALVLTAFPTVLLATVPQLPASFTAGYHGLVSGVPQVVGGIVGTVGIVLLTRRRRQAYGPSSRGGSAAGHIIGILVGPALLLGGLLLLLRGLRTASQQHLALVGLTTDPLWLLALLAGFVLILAAVLLAHWSPFSLALSAVAVLLLTLLAFVPSLIGPVTTLLPTALPFFVLGGLVTAAALGAGTVVLLLPRPGARRAARASVGH